MGNSIMKISNFLIRIIDVIHAPINPWLISVNKIIIFRKLHDLVLIRMTDSGEI
jgi:hypothetical protein